MAPVSNSCEIDLCMGYILSSSLSCAFVSSNIHFKGSCAAVNSWIETLLRRSAVKFTGALPCSNSI